MQDVPNVVISVKKALQQINGRLLAVEDRPGGIKHIRYKQSGFTSTFNFCPKRSVEENLKSLRSANFIPA